MNFCPNCGHDLREERQTPRTTGTPGLVPSQCPIETTCTWRKYGSVGWTCSHGVIVQTHPFGWCDQGCCR